MLDESTDTREEEQKQEQTYNESLQVWVQAHGASLQRSDEKK